MRVHFLLNLLVLVWLAPAAAGETARWTLRNDGPGYREKLVRLGVELPASYDGTKLKVTEGGKEVAYQVEVHKGVLRSVDRGDVWVCATAAAGESKTYEVTTDATPAAFEKKVVVKRDGDDYVLDNGAVAVRIVAAAPRREVPGPIRGVKAAGGKWAGSSEWHASVWCNGVDSRLHGDGTLFAKVEILYFFVDPGYNGTVPFASVTVRLHPGETFARVEEEHVMYAGDHWELSLPGGDLVIRDAEGLVGEAKLGVLGPGAMGSAAVSSEGGTMKVSVARPEAWEEGKDNAMRVSRGEKGEGVRVKMPTEKGKRFWWLGTGGKSSTD